MLNRRIDFSKSDVATFRNELFAELRREGIEFLLDPMWQSVNDDLHEHVDGIVSAFPKPSANRNQQGAEN